MKLTSWKKRKIKVNQELPKLIDIRFLLVFEFHVLHQILYTALATDEKWPLTRFQISYQNLEINWWKMPILNSKWFIAVKNQPNLYHFFLKNIKLGDQLLLMKYFEKKYFENTLFSKNMSIFCQIFKILIGF